MKKLLALFLCLLMVASVVIGCSGEKTPGGETGGTKNTGDQTSGKTDPVSSDDPDKDDLPADLDYKGMTIRTAYREDKVAFFLGENNAEVVDVAVYKANEAVDARLNIKRE